MSHTSRRPRTAAERGALGLPLWSGVAIVVAALATGMLISLSTQEMGALYLGCFALAAIVVALFTQPRGLFLTVAALPLSFGVFTVATAWLIGRQLSPNVSGASTTALITAVYPMFQFFPVLILVVLGAAAIATVRLVLLHRVLAREQRRHVADRRREAAADRRNRETATRARRRSDAARADETRTLRRVEKPDRARESRRGSRSHDGGDGQITVEELLRRSERRRTNRSRRVERLNRDLYED